MFSVFVFSKLGVPFRDLLFVKKSVKFSYFLLWDAEISLLSGLCLRDIIYFVVFVIHVSKLGSYQAFTNFTRDRNLRSHVRNHHFSKTIRRFLVFINFKNILLEVIFGDYR